MILIKQTALVPVLFGLQALMHNVFRQNNRSSYFCWRGKQLAEEALSFPTWILCWLSGCYELKEAP